MICRHWSTSKPPTNPKANEGRINRCRICGKIYARPSTLKTHLRPHSGEKVRANSNDSLDDSLVFFLLSHTNAINVRKHLLKLLISLHIYVHIQVKNHFHVIYVDENFHKVHLLRHICEHIRVNDLINVNIVEKLFRIVQH